MACMSELATIKVKEVAEILGVSRPTVLRYVKAGQLPAIKIGRAVLILRKPLEKLLNLEPKTP